MTMWINHESYACELCGRLISRPNYSRHLTACKRKRSERAEAVASPKCDGKLSRRVLG